MKFPFTNPDVGKLVLRAGLGAMFIIVHGWPKLMGGPERWTRVGTAMSSVGIDVAPIVWGLAAALTETFGGLLLIAGFYTRAASLFLTLVMVVAAARNISADGLFGAAHPIEVGVALIGLMFIGAGKYSLDGNLS